MPELPDLEVFSQNLGKHLMGKKLTRVTVLEKGIKSNVSSSRLKKSLEGAVVKAVWRDGKELFFQLKNEDEGNCQESAA